MLQSIQGEEGAVSCYDVCSHRKSELKKKKKKRLHHIITHKLDPGFSVEPADQLTNIWTCLCFISQPLVISGEYDSNGSVLKFAS